MVQRVTYRRRKSFATKSNVVRKVRTPGGKLTLQYVGKQAKRTGCGESGCDRPLSGVRRSPPHNTNASGAPAVLGPLPPLPFDIPPPPRFPPSPTPLCPSSAAASPHAAFTAAAAARHTPAARPTEPRF